MSDQNLFDLYSQKILALAMDIPHLAPITGANGTAMRRSATCGSQIEVSLRYENGQIIEFSQVVKACALGQASAAIFGAQVTGQDEATIRTLHDQMAAFLVKSGPAPTLPFDEFIALTPAQDYKNRHASIMLVINATLDAIESAKGN